MIAYFIENFLPLFTLVYLTTKEITNHINMSNLTHSYFNLTHSYLLINDSLLLTFCD